MTPGELAVQVIDKYGADADKPSVHLAASDADGAFSSEIEARARALGLDTEAWL